MFVRPEEGARLIGVSRSTIYRLMRRGEIPSTTVGKCRRIPVAALVAWAEAVAAGGAS